jgi:hypothetical protein
MLLTGKVGTVPGISAEKIPRQREARFRKGLRRLGGWFRVNMFLWHEDFAQSDGWSTSGRFLF